MQKILGIAELSQAVTHDKLRIKKPPVFTSPLAESEAHP
jgi:hypothetical protein